MKPWIINKRIMVLLTMMSVIVLLGKAQSNLVFYHIHDQFNSSGFNPAFLTSQQNYTFSILPFSGMSVSYNNQAIIGEMATQVLPGNQTDILSENQRKQVFTDLFKSLADRNLFYQRFEMTLFNFGYNLTTGSFNFRIKEIEQMLMDFKGEFSQFLVNPTFQTIFINEPQLFPAMALHYREYSLGYAKKLFDNKLSFGIRAKLYYGKSSFISQASGEVVAGENNFYLKTSGSIKLSAPVNTIINSDDILQPFVLSDNFTPANYLINSNNSGTGLDIGLNYKINSNIMLSASVVDFGKINWKYNLISLNLKGEFEFPLAYSESSGVDFLSKKNDFSIDKENFYELFMVDEQKGAIAYSTALPTNFYCGLQYQIKPNLNIGMVNRYIYSKALTHNSFSLTASYNLKTNLTVSSGYSIIGNSYYNLPLAILFNWDSGQSYIGTDNALSFLFRSGSEFSGITFGTCIYLFRKKVKYKNETENQPFFKQKIPRPVSKKGLIFNNYHDS